MGHKDSHNPGGGGQRNQEYRVVARSLLKGKKLDTQEQWNSRRPDNGVGRPYKWEYRDNNGSAVSKGVSAKRLEYFGRTVDIRVVEV